ncbi:MAG: 2-polyprenylphenol 6-hydroxylase, partial [Alphaproteobacteria bacterium]
MLRAARNILRLLTIARTLARHDALFPLTWLPALGWIARTVEPLAAFAARPDVRDRRAGERLAMALEALGPSFIKLGQALSTRSDLIGDRLAADLGALRDRLPPFPSHVARSTIENELGKSVPELFAAFDDRPVAAASIAQVHLAMTRGSSGAPDAPVAVKVLRPGVEQAFERDLEAFRWLARVIDRTRPRLRRLRLNEVVETLAESVRQEMDLRLEAAAASELGENFRGDPTYRVPSVDWSRTARRVLTLERVHGIPVHEAGAVRAAGHDPDEIVGRAVVVFFNQVFRDGFFHADMHPGNLFVAGDGALVAVDFGIMGRLDWRTRTYLADMLAGLLTHDYERVADAHFRAGYVPAHKSRAAFTQAVRSIAEPIFGRPTHEISIARLLGRLFGLAEQFEMAARPELLLLQKTMLMAEGVG